ncbi:MAG TPA: ABC transporter permease, partial [Vicinamibacterales bacterium]|nr:ABC transporter permease [Vicinamibacterales bacterium]
MFSQVRFATRGLIRWRGGALAAVVTLAIGIGAATALYGLVQVILPGLPGVPDVDRLGRIYASSPELGVERSPIAINEFDDTLSKTRSFAAIGAYAETDAAIGSGADVQPATAAYATPAFFTAMGVPPAAGRAFTAADLGQPVVIVSEALWRRQFGDRRLEGAAITVDGVERAVVGVMPPEFAYRFIGISGDLWIPLGRASIKAPVIVSIYARLRTGVDWTAAASELSALSRGEWKWRAIPVDADMRSRATMAYAFTLGPALLILLIACVNVACMLLGRGLQREKELSVRRALGASRAAIVRLLLVENLVLAIAAGAIGAGLAIWILRAAGGVLSALQPGVARVVADARLLPFALGASAMACLLFGMVPALRLSRRDVAASLNGVPPEHRVEIAGYGGRDVIVFAEIASAVGLIVWTAMLFTLFGELRAIHFTFPAESVVAMRVPAETAGAVAARVASVPGVTGAAISSGMMGGSRVRAQAQG